MAVPKPPYDPIKSIEGMFNGSITRIAYMLKDPANFGQGTKTVLAECSKRFQDALDDCEIQLLDAKWYLEHQLAQNKARREAKARETAASAKRKHDEIKDAGDKEGREDAVKKPRLGDGDKGDEPVPAADSIPATGQPTTARPSTSPRLSKGPTPDNAKESQNKAALPKIETKSQPSVPEKPPELAPELRDFQPQSATDDFPKATPQVTPSATNDDFNFVSMFGDPTGDTGEGTGNMDFDLNLGDDFGAGLNDQNPTNLVDGDSSLSALLPGLESYANQAGDDNNVFSLGDGATTTMTTTNNNNNVPAMNNFDLPNLATNDFDDFLNANNFDDADFDGHMNLNDDVLTSMDNMDNLDFDSMFA